MRLILWFFVLFDGYALAASENKPYFSFFGTSFRIGGAPAASHIFNAVRSFDFANLIVIDADCGRWVGDCARYCEDGTFLHIFCSYKCRTVTPQSMGAICNRFSTRNRFNGSASPTAEKLYKNWTWEAAGLRRMYGQLWSEQIQLTVYPRIHSIRPKLRIVSTDSFDTRVLDYSGGVVGMAPGPNNPFVQMVKIHRLHSPMVSMAMNYWPVKWPRKRYRGRFVTTVGYLDMGRCADWKFVNSTSPTGWAFEIDEVDFMGVKLGKSVGAFSASSERFALISTMAAERLTSRRIMKFYAAIENGDMDSFTSLVKCDPARGQLPPTRIRSGDVELVFAEGATFRSPIFLKDWKVTCLLNVNVDRRSPQHQSNVWIFGQALYREYCLAFDYANLRIGFGKLRKSPFPFLQRWNANF